MNSYQKNVHYGLAKRKYQHYNHNISNNNNHKPIREDSLLILINFY